MIPMNVVLCISLLLVTQPGHTLNTFSACCEDTSVSVHKFCVKLKTRKLGEAVRPQASSKFPYNSVFFSFCGIENLGARQVVTTTGLCLPKFYL